MALLLCFVIVVCLSACGDSVSGENTTGVTNAYKTEKAKKFSDEAEFKNYTESFWFCEEKTNDRTIFKLRLFSGTYCISWDFSYSSTETLEDCIKNVLKHNEEQGQYFKTAAEFHLANLNVSGLESNKFDVEYDAKKGQINTNGQNYGTFLNDGTLKCNGDIYYKVGNAEELFEAFFGAKESIFTDTYGELATYKDVKYDTYTYLGRRFLLTGTAELSDYFNYDYRDIFLYSRYARWRGLFG